MADVSEDVSPPANGRAAGGTTAVPLSGSLDPADASVDPFDGVRRRSMQLVTLAWMFGAVWVVSTSGAPLTQFAKHLGCTEMQFGILTALPFIASLCSLPASLLVDRTGERKFMFFVGLYLNRLMWPVIAFLPLWLLWRGTDSRVVALVFLALTFAMHTGQAIGSPGWVSWMADLVPEHIRGTYFSRRRQLGMLTAIPAAVVVGLLLDRLTSGGASRDAILLVCALLFLVGSVFGLVDIAVFHAVPHRARPRASRPLMETLLIPLKDRHFLWFAGFVATMVFAVSFMGQFATLFLIQKLQVNNTQVQLMLIAAPMLAQLAVLHVWGKAADRMGKKPMLAIAALGLVPVGAAWVLMNSGAIWLGYVLSMLGAALWVGVETANFNLVMQFSGSGEDDDGEAKGGSGYVAVNSVIVNIAGCAGGLLAGWIATLLRDFHWETGWLGAITYFEILFFISAALRLLAVVVFLPRVHEPEARPTMETLRFMTTNIYNNLFSAISVPLRLVKAGLSSGAPDRPGKKREG